MYEALVRDAPAALVFLVPVRHLALRGDHLVPQTTEAPAQSILLTGGILMPFYSCTLADWSDAIASRKPGTSLLESDITFVAETISRMASTLRFLHTHGWLHGDVKPSNIFLDNEGKAWLGDYGSSWLMAEAPTDMTGTPAFTCPCQEIPALRGGVFDLVGLAICMLSVLGFLDPNAAAMSGWQMTEVHAALQRVTPERIKLSLVQLLPL